MKQVLGTLVRFGLITTMCLALLACGSFGGPVGPDPFDECWGENSEDSEQCDEETRER